MWNLTNMTQKELSNRIIAAHDGIVFLEQGIEEAVADKRFKLSLIDSQKLKDILNDIEIIAVEAEVKSMDIPTYLPINGLMQKQELAKSVEVKTESLK